MTQNRIPAPANMTQTDLSDFCKDGPLPDPPLGQQVVLLGPLAQSLRMIHGTWTVPAGASLTFSGQDAVVDIEDGAVSIVACGASLVFDTIEGDDTAFEAPAGYGVRFEAPDVKTVLLSLQDTLGTVSLVAETSARVTIDIRTDSEQGAICAGATCWGKDDVTETIHDLVDAEMCVLSRCWSW